ERRPRGIERAEQTVGAIRPAEIAAKVKSQDRTPDPPCANGKAEALKGMNEGPGEEPAPRVRSGEARAGGVDGDAVVVGPHAGLEEAAESDLELVTDPVPQSHP